MILETVRTFARKELLTKAEAYDRSGEYPWPQLHKLAELGLLGMTTPEAWGGAGLDNATYTTALSILSAADPSVGVIISVTSGLPQYMILAYGNDAQKERFLKPMAAGEWIGAFCLTEAHAGSDAASLKTRATKVDGGYLLNGTKAWITSGGQAQLYVVLARTGEPGRNGISAFLVERGTPGLSFGKPEDKMGLHAAHTSEVHFGDVLVPNEQLLGQEGMGFSYALSGLDTGRLGIAAQAVGIAQGAFNIAKLYADTREQFGQKLRKFEGVSFKLADMATKIQAAELLVAHAAWKKDLGLSFRKEASMAKLFASETAVEVTRAAVQVLGGNGYARDYLVERYYRDAKITEIYEGTNEIQRIVITRELYKDG